jgi:hypothetical protein
MGNRHIANTARFDNSSNSRLGGVDDDAMLASTVARSYYAGGSISHCVIILAMTNAG